MLAPDVKTEFEAFAAASPRTDVDLILWGLTKAVEAERERCARICDGLAEVNRDEAMRRGKALGKASADKDEKCAALWATHHAANELASVIRGR